MPQTLHETKGKHKQPVIDHTSVEHHQRVAVAAYFHAEHRGFKGGDPVADWLAAEAEIDAALNKGKGAGTH